jgi:phosphoesterase RecJ-like protein
LDKYGVSLSDTEGLIDSFRILDKVVIAALITRRGKGFKISLRSNDTDYSVADIAHKLNGGGHKLAAGCFIETDNYETVEKRVAEYVKELLKSKTLKK